MKLTADYLYWGWVHTFVSQLSVKNYKTKFFEDVSYHKLQIQFDILLSGIPFQNYQYGENIVFKTSIFLVQERLRYFFMLYFVK